jgi:type VI secretion system protein ImpF
VQPVAELIPKERLQPSLLDRLTDDEPDKAQESREKRVLSMKRLRESVLRDLAWLFNASALGRAHDLDDYPLIAHSVVNFGLPDLAGRAASGVDLSDIERLLRQAIWDFEPRILRGTVKVRVVPSEDRLHRHNVLVFDIEGELWGQPMPIQLFLKTEVDLEMGEVKVSDYSGRG